MTITHTNTRTHNRFTDSLRVYLSEAVPEEILLLDFIVQEKITEADTLTIWMGATPSRLISDPPPAFPVFYAATLQIYPGLGQALNMLVCIPIGLVVN